MPLLPLIYIDVTTLLPLITILIHLLSSDPTSSARSSSVRLPSLQGPYLRHGASSAITSPSSIFGLYRMYSSFSLAPRRIRLFDLTIAIDI